MTNSSTPTINFGTSGHRGIIGQDISPEHIKAIAVGIASLFSAQDTPTTLLIGCDPRTGNDLNCSPSSFTGTLTQTLNECGVNTISYNNFIPTPMLSWLITHLNADGGIILTASHNPPEYNGIKFNPKNGAPAPQTITQHIEQAANRYAQTPYPLTSQQPGTHHINDAPFEAFSVALKQNIEALGINMPTFKKSLNIDVKHGVCGEAWKHISTYFGLPIELHHAEPRSDFGNIEPNPTKYEHLSNPSPNAYFSAANDPDGDRHAVLTADGLPLTPEELTVIITDYLATHAQQPAAIASTLASSHRIAYICQQLSISYYETAVGFKYIAPHLETGKQSNCIYLGVESSGGFSSSTHTLEKCGFLPILALAAILEHQNCSLTDLQSKMKAKYGTFIFTETEFKFQPKQKSAIQTFMNNSTPQSLAPHFEKNIEKINTTDGLKLYFSDQSWVLCRLSGTEPVIRIYAESSEKETSKKRENELLTLVKSIL